MPELIDLTDGNRDLAEKLGIKAEIHAQDFIYHYLERRWHGDRERAVNNYFNIGKYGASLTKEILDEVLRVKKRTAEAWTPQSILDFASGYGNSSRHMKPIFEGMSVSTCDIHEEAMRFNKDVLMLDSFISNARPEQLDIPKHDIIVAMSFFSHVPDSAYQRWLRALSLSLNVGGILIFTANGYVTDKTGGTGIEVDERGFGFLARSEQHDLEGEQYGLTISYPKYVFDALLGVPELRLSRFHEGLWWTTQDTYVCMRL
jgi:SAM-dependent methyltransferase